MRYWEEDGSGSEFSVATRRGRKRREHHPLPLKEQIKEGKKSKEEETFEEKIQHKIMQRNILIQVLSSLLFVV